jgi:glycosyltransferase involved in cell wall biosynthesis
MRDAGTGIWPAGTAPDAAFEPGLVSVVVPTHNRADLLVETLDSVAWQTYRPVEVLVVDDGSTDETKEAVGRWGEAQRGDAGLSVRYIHQENAGVQTARNRGLAASRGQYIQYLDSDDLMHPERLQRMVGALEEDAALDCVWADYECFEGEPDWSKADRPVVRREPTVETALRWVPWITVAPLYRRRCCLRMGPWRTDFMIFHDWEYGMRLAVLGARMRQVEAVLMLVRIHGEGRLSDDYATVSALRDRLRAMTTMEEMISGAGLLSRGAREALATRYFDIEAGAAGCGASALAEEAARHALRVRPGPWRVARVELVRLVALLGPEVSVRVMRLLQRGAAALNAAVGAVDRQDGGASGEGYSAGGTVKDRTGMWPAGKAPEAAFEPGLVSVVVPTHNRAGLLVETLDSVSAQTHRPVELVVVDDGSTDETEAVVAAWRAVHGDVEVRYVRQEPQGPGAARNQGLRLSRGEFIQYLDSDDLLAPEKLASQVSALRAAPAAGFVLCDLRTFGGQREWEIRVRPSGTDRRGVLEAYLSGQRWPPLSPLYRRVGCLRVGAWHEGIRGMEDWEYEVRAIVVLEMAPVLERVLGLYRVSGAAENLSVRSAREGRYVAYHLAAQASAWGAIPEKLRTRAVRLGLARSLVNIGRRGWEANRADCAEALRRAAELSRGTGYRWQVVAVGAGLRLAGGRVVNALYEGLAWLRRLVGQRAC